MNDVVCFGVVERVRKVKVIVSLVGGFFGGGGWWFYYDEVGVVVDLLEVVD